MNTERSQDAQVRVDARNLRGIAHPLRVRMLGMLRSDGPATATGLAERLGLNTGATSYHLRQLAEYGFVDEDLDRGTGRERWWKAIHQSSTFSDAEMLADDQGLGITYMRSVAQTYLDRISRAVDELPTLPLKWREVSTMSDYLLRLTPDEAMRLESEIAEVVKRYRQHSDTATAPADAKRGALQFQYLPFAADLETDGEDNHS